MTPKATHRLTLPEVLAAIKAGREFVGRGGRCFSTYLEKNGQLTVVEFDEGTTYDTPITEADLAKAIERDPDTFVA